jgi:putative peptidoglycan lipid II flippase
VTPPPPKPSSLLRDSTAFSLATSLSRVFGYCRDAALAAIVPTELTDLFLACFRLPNTFRRLFGEGAVSVAFIPTFTKVWESNPKEARNLFGATLSVVGLVTLIVVLAGILTSPWYLPFYLDLPEGPERQALESLSIALLAWMFPYLTLICLAAVITGVLNTRGSFFVPALNPVYFNLATILATLCYWWFENPSLVWLGFGVFVGGALQVLLMAPTLIKSGAFPTWNGNPFADPHLKKALALFLPATVTLGVTQINLLVNTKLALALGQGPNSYLFYADRLAELPLGVFGIAIAAASFPRFSKSALDADKEKLKAPLLNSLNGTFLVSLPAMVGIWVLAVPLVDLLFNRGEFARMGGLAGTVPPLRIYVLGLISFSCVKIFGNLSYAVGDARSPIVAGVCSMAVNLCLAYWLRFTWLTHSGIALATVMGATVNVLVLIFCLRERISIGWLFEILPLVGRILVSSLLMGCGVHLFIGWIADSARWIEVLGGVSLGGTLYILLAKLLFPKQLDPLLERALRKVR